MLNPELKSPAFMQQNQVMLR